jgi:hypothetical protein
MKQYLVKDKTLSSLVKWMNENYIKQTGKPFTVGDIQQYIFRGRIPEYLGGNSIDKNDKIENVKLYSIVK